MKKSGSSSPTDKSFEPNFGDLLHPARAFAHPRDIVHDPDLTLNEKRAILASWASDACAVETAPALHQPPGADRMVPVDEILEALRTLNRQAQQDSPQVSWARRQIRRRSIRNFRRRRARSEPGHDLSQ
jgi:hypothetical protein